MKKRILIILSVLFLFGCNHINKEVTYAHYDSIPQDYQLQDAIHDQCFVVKDFDTIYNQSVLDSFLKKTSNGEDAFLRYVHYYSDSGDGESLFVFDLTYEFNTYKIYHKEDDREYIETYQYLKKYEGELTYVADEVKNKNYTTYVLINDDSLTYEQIEWSMFSSQSDDFIDYQTLYLLTHE